MMKIKDLVTPGNEMLVAGSTALQADRTIFQALDQFLKLKLSGSLPVYQQGKYIGNLALIDITNHLLGEHKIEKDKRYRFTRGLMINVIRLRNLAKQIPAAEHRLKFVAECDSIIMGIKDYI
ncbi:hypothetical protein [Pararcticibacter amylolyticus]|uniref:CBS domain-containing protein n=1 Tax=Pararcticibacter amylolyticus TaxID=2173175 RepID=A0A2U2PHC6_9SPHI|nr:hypothetical protein [Pararcticibacter amylolyticus]PWG80791.1 hypothetical protein DDR33_10055 [Pararcticibacter amylolyticus]